MEWIDIAAVIIIVIIGVFIYRNKSKALCIALLSLPVAAGAQTENPRGIYRLVTLTGKMGEIKAPFDQYKICTDSVTLMLSAFKEGAYNIVNTDHKVFNYTGEQPKTEYDRSTLIYDSYADRFTMKWWSETRNHLYFPENGWCIEKYEAGNYSEVAKPAFEALTAVPALNPTNPLLGTWRVIGWMDELKGAKKQLAEMIASRYEVRGTSYENSSVGKGNLASRNTTRYEGEYVSIAPDAIVYSNIAGRAVGVVRKGGCRDKNSFVQNGETLRVKWLKSDIIAVERHIDYRTDYEILERVTDGTTLLSRIASMMKP